MMLPLEVHTEQPIPVLTQAQIDLDERVPDGTLTFKGDILVWLQHIGGEANRYGTHYISHRMDRSPMFWGGGSGWAWPLRDMRPPSTARELLIVEAFRTWYAYEEARDLADLAESRHAQARSALTLLARLENEA